MRPWALAPLLLAAACVSPPESSTITFRLDPQAGQATYQQDLDSRWAGADVYIFDETTQVGVIAVARIDGSVTETLPFSAHAGDRISVRWFEPDFSADMCLLLRDGRAGDDIRLDCDDR